MIPAGNTSVNRQRQNPQYSMAPSHLDVTLSYEKYRLSVISGMDDQN